MLRYPAKFKPAKEGGFVVTFRDIPEAITQRESVEDAMIRARDALETEFDFYFDDRREVPAPSKARRGERSLRGKQPTDRAPGEKGTGE
jgi:antitoxin HicB